MSITLVIILLCIGYFIFTIDKKQEFFPVPIILLLIGIVLSFIPYFSDVEVTEHMIYNVFLPGLLFIAAYQFSTKALRKIGGIIGLLSTVGVVTTAVLLGLLIYYIGGLFLPVSFIGALVVAAILVPNDPVSVTSILKQTVHDQSIVDIVEGESMFNDASSVVLFGVLSGMYINENAFNLWSILGEFAYVSIGGTGLGIIAGWILSKAVHITHHREYQIMLSIVIAYGVFQLAEAFGFSGVLATVAAGIVLSWEFTHMNKEDHYYEALSGFWGVVEPTLLSLLFLLIGIRAPEYLSSAPWGLAMGIFVLSILIRFLVITATMNLFNEWRKMMDWKKASLISWAGIRGTMSVFLLLSLDAMATDNTNTILSLAFSVVFISLVLQSLGIYPLLKWLEHE
ncbi:cation:proton antiporter [Bacillus solitudinis]|uniref:cation:proton antiporter n=1 Tax=Bacillus solitudinis TaxID=2014074 RepID=UPI000C23DB47|nr:sodium:proton antiporter [Bacillus solitudinis]